MVEKNKDLKMYSFRLEMRVVNALKKLAKKEGMLYQPFIRQILTNWVNKEKAK